MTVGTGRQHPQQPSEPVGAWPTGQVGLVVWQTSIQKSPSFWGLGSALVPMAAVAIAMNKVAKEDFMAMKDVSDLLIPCFSWTDLFM